jgi:hypothetical protein
MVGEQIHGSLCLRNDALRQVVNSLHFTHFKSLDFQDSAANSRDRHGEQQFSEP